jgi:hypothetical protein
MVCTFCVDYCIQLIVKRDTLKVGEVGYLHYTSLDKDFCRELEVYVNPKLLQRLIVLRSNDTTNEAR